MARKAGDSKANQQKIKKALIELLQKTPIVESCCQKVGIGRATYYRWYQEDHIFKTEVQEALGLSRNVVNDIAISKLIEAIQRGEPWAIKFWLQHNHENFMLPILGGIKEENVSNVVMIEIPKNGREEKHPDEYS